MKKVIMLTIAAIFLLCACSGTPGVDVDAPGNAPSAGAGGREISVVELTGSATIQSEGKDSVPLAVGTKIQRGDVVVVGADGLVKIDMDGDKTITLDQQAEVCFDAIVDEKNNQITNVYLMNGYVISEINKELSEGSTYDIITGKSKISAKGTVFVTGYFLGMDNIPYVEVLTLNGKVMVQLLDDAGNTIGDPLSLSEGNQTEVTEGTKGSKPEFVVESVPLVLSVLTTEVLKQLEQITQSGKHEFGEGLVNQIKSEVDNLEPGQADAEPVMDNEPDQTIEPTVAPKPTPTKKPSTKATAKPTATPSASPTPSPTKTSSASGTNLQS